MGQGAGEADDSPLSTEGVRGGREGHRRQALTGDGGAGGGQRDFLFSHKGKCKTDFLFGVFPRNYFIKTHLNLSVFCP